MKPDLTNIKNIIFDLGNVLLNLDFQATIEAFKKIGFHDDVFNNRQLYNDPVFHDFETGKISSSDFCNGIRKFLNNPVITDYQILEAWSAMIKDVPENRVSKLKDLKSTYQVYLFSNTNQVHIAKMNQTFESKYGFVFSSLFIKDFYSHELGISKPDNSSYQKVIESSGIKPAESLFVDDLERNIFGAKNAGLQTFWLKEGMEMAELF